jgi:hypothetical protein
VPTKNIVRIEFVDISAKADVGSAESRAALHLEILALRQQMAILTHSAPKRYRFQTCQRIFWAWLFGVWPACLETFQIV